MTIPQAEANPYRPWYRLHTTTLVIVLVICAAVAHLQLQSRGGSDAGGIWRFTKFYYHGWPLIALHRWEHHAANLNVTFTYTTTTQFLWSKTGVAINATASLALLGSTIFACERWCRRSCRMWQLSIRSLLMLVTIASFTLFVYLNEFWIRWWWAGLLDDGSILLHGGLRLSPLYSVVPTMFGLGCVIFAAGWMVVVSASLLARLFSNDARPLWTRLYQSQR